MSEKEELVVEEQEIIAVPDRMVDEIIEITERRVQVLERLKTYAISKTKKSDWVDLGGKPYLLTTAAESVGRYFPIKIIRSDINQGLGYEKQNGTDERGEYYIYTYYGKVKMSDHDEMDVIGACSSRDKFFGVVDGELKPLAFVDEVNIKKKAYNNFIRNAITRILGIRNVTYDDLKLTFDKKEVAKVDYKSKKTSEGQDKDKMDTQIADIERMLKAMYQDEKVMIEKLVEFTKYANLAPAKTFADLKKFSEKRLFVVHAKIKREYDKVESMLEKEQSEMPLEEK